MDKAVFADSISPIPEWIAWYKVIKDFFGDYDLGKLLVYMIDTVDASALQYLAEQFDVLGYKGLKLAKTEADQREILKRAIELHKYKGTEWAIKEALKSIGFADVVIKKGLADGYDHWAKFGLDITNSNVQLTAEGYNDIIQMVSEYKRAVCVLDAVSMTLLVEDVLDISEDDAAVVPALVVEDELSLSGTLRYDGEGHYDGEFDHSGDSDIVSLTIL